MEAGRCDVLAVGTLRGTTRNVMGKVVNLNRFRKRKAREEQKQRAESNRRLHGRTKGERLREAADKNLLEKRLSGARLEPDKVPPDGDPLAAVPRPPN